MTGRFRLCPLGIQYTAVKRVVLDLLGNAVHRRDRLHRVLSGGGFLK